MHTFPHAHTHTQTHTSHPPTILAAHGHSTGKDILMMSVQIDKAQLVDHQGNKGDIHTYTHTHITSTYLYFEERAFWQPIATAQAKIYS